ncbi:hypothetical protein EJD97_001868, partial [Solanum chilense]
GVMELVLLPGNRELPLLQMLRNHQIQEREGEDQRGKGIPKYTSACSSANATAIRASPTTTVPPTTSRITRATGSASASRVSPRTIAHPTTSRTPRYEASASLYCFGVSSSSRSGRGRGTGLGSAGRGSNHPLESWFTCSQGSTTQGVDQNTNNAPKEIATRKRKGVENTTQFKRSRVTGMGVFQAEIVLKTFNILYPGLPSSRILARRKRVLRSSIITGDVGFKPTSGLKWKGNKAITTRRLQ